MKTNYWQIKDNIHVYIISIRGFEFEFSNAKKTEAETIAIVLPNGNVS